MKNTKIYTMLFAIILLSGSAFAVNELINVEGIDMPSNMIGGGVITANFSFAYVDDTNNEDNVPLIVKLNFISADEVNYPVWKGDFEVDGYIEKTSWFGFWTKTTYFDCDNSEFVEINHTINSVIIPNSENGTFYCYDESGDLRLNEKDNVFLNIKPNLAIWPGTYTLTAQLFYLNDTTDPIVLILDQSYFNQYFRDGSYVDFNARIYDGSGIQNYYSLIEENNREISLNKEIVSNEIYHFYQTLPIDITEGEYTLRVVAIDNYGHTSEDTATIKIDLTSPVIELLDMGNNVFGNTIPIKINVTDLKSGVDYEEVYYRLREIKEGFGLCPENGQGFSNETTCYNSGWINAPYNLGLELNYNLHNSENMTEGEYWIEIRAQDILLNFGVLE